MRIRLMLTCFVIIGSAAGCAELHAAEASFPDFERQVLPILQKYCVGCHNADDANGDLSLESFDALQRGGENGPVVLAGQSRSSRLIRVLNGQAEPKMPPDDSAAPSEAEIAVLVAWIDAGALGPAGAEPDRTRLLTPRLPPARSEARPITAIDVSSDGRYLAVARFSEVELRNANSGEVVYRFAGLPGKVNGLRFSGDGTRLIAASGVAGLYGRAAVWNVQDGSLVRQLTGHRDILYAAVPDPAGQLLATAGYDRRIVLWDLSTGEPLRNLEGHNDAIYDLAFSPDGTILASASGDETVKLWHVASGIRLDTLGQPLAAQLTVAFSPDGRYVVAGGADNRIRVWRVVSRDKPQINPLVHARFGHEGAILQLRFAGDGRMLISVAEDRTIKLWETQQFTQTHVWSDQPDIAHALAAPADGDWLMVGRMDGSLQKHRITERAGAPRSPQAEELNSPAPNAPLVTTPQRAPVELREQEPNDEPPAANPLELPATVRGVIEPAIENAGTDQDLFRFTSGAGQQWIVEIDAAQSGSPLDSRVEVLGVDGQPVPRVLLEAVRDSYFTFRGKDSDTSDDFRVHNWEEMELNEFLYANGEVVRLWLYPRGPDSGFKVYPGTGKRYTYFDTTANAHALHEPCYIVRPHPPGSQLIPNGLPTFALNYENDDDSRRELGSDSRLMFTAPADGDYLVRVSDTRGFAGPEYKYQMTVRPRQPDFRVRLDGAGATVPTGSGREFSVTAQRIDGFEGPIRVDLRELPPGFHATTPLVIEAGQQTAYGTIHADADAPQPTAENAAMSRVTATAEIKGREVTHEVGSLGEIKLGEKPKVLVRILPAVAEPAAAESDSESSFDRPLELTIQPGQTVQARVRIERNGFDGQVSFGKEDSGRNLPHGVFVDNIGLNGLLILEGNSERTFFLTAAKWVPETTRMFYLKADTDGGQTSLPMLLHVRHR